MTRFPRRVVALVAVAVILAGAYLAAGWKYSTELLTPVGGGPVAVAAAAPASPTPPTPPAGAETVSFTSDVGTVPGWLVRPETAPDDTWAVYVHGRGAEREDGLRLVPTLTEAGLPTLLIAYRNDVEAPPSGDGLYHLGASEWRDVDAAIGYALAAGAADVIVIGDSMGGAIAAMCARRCEHADAVTGMVLDAPALAWGPILEGQARERGLPPFLAGAAEVVTGLRTPADFDELDQIAHADEFDVPMLLVHGDADELVPVELSRTFAEEVGEGVTYEEFPGAGHVLAWDTDPERYARVLRAFLDRVAD